MNEALSFSDAFLYYNLRFIFLSFCLFVFNNHSDIIERGGSFNLAKRITGSKNTIVRDRGDFRVVQVTVNTI